MYFKLLKNKQKTKENPVLKNKKTQEKSRGRSMVEMLGVLAIIGVLSIGGIAGYTIAMRRYQANEILNITNKYAAILWTEVQQKMINDPDNNYWWTPNDGYADNKYNDISEELAKELGVILFSNWGGGDLTSFENAGLGAKPSGLSEVSINGIIGGKSGLLVVLTLTLQNHTLCETVKSMTDIDERVAKWTCQLSDSDARDDKRVDVYFYQK